MDHLFDLLVASLLPGVSARTVRALSERGRVGDALARPGEHPDLLGPAARARLASGEARRAAETELERLTRLGARAVARDAPDYPAALRECYDPPPVLFVRGVWPPPASRHWVAVVGARSATPSGTALAREIAQGLAEAGALVVSGLARGIDAAAHRGSLAGQGWTAAVLGTGLDRVYPAEHAELAAQVRESGALVTEFPLGTPPRPGHFPLRNRILAGLAGAVVVVEASARSGALITARLALDEGRDVLAVPGHPHHALAAGTNALIRDGARLVRGAADVAEELGLGDVRPVTVEPGLLGLLQAPLSVEELCARSGQPPGELIRQLTELELEARVRRLPGARYVRN